jgi:Glycosyltransferase family 87
VEGDGIQNILQRKVNPRPRKRASRRDEVDEAGLWLGAVACLLLIASQALVTSQALVGRNSALDYGSFYASGSLANLHDNPYRDHLLVNHIRGFNRFGPDTPLQGKNIDAINLNPPVVLYLFRLLARLEPRASFKTWQCISVGLFTASILIVLRMYPEAGLRIRLLWVLALGGVWYTFLLGQIYTILLLGTVLAWWALRKQKQIIAGIAIGLVCAVKPNFLVWPGLLIVGRSKKTGFTAMATTSVLSAIPLVLQGPIVYRQWIALCREYNGFELPTNSSLLAMFSRAGIPSVGYATTIAMLMAVTVWVFIKKPDTLYTSEIGLLASLFAGPISWIGYTIMLIPVLYGKSMDTPTRIGSVLLCIPLWVSIPIGQISRIAYILFEAPSFYGLVLIGIGTASRGLRSEIDYLGGRARPLPVEVA